MSRARDPFTAAHWNGRVRVVIHPLPSQGGESEVRRHARALFGPGVGDQVWAKLVGAPDGATIEAAPWFGFDHTVRLLAHHPWFDGAAVRFVYRDEAARVAILNELLRLRDDAPDGVGTRLLAHQVAAARALGVAYLTAYAAGGPGGTMNGYYTWARLGFDGLIPASVRGRLPPEWRGLRYVLDVMEQTGGPAWWRANGRSYEGTFDLRDGSRSLFTLHTYTSGRGIAV